MPLATYQGLRPKIVWTVAGTPPDDPEAWTEDFEGYADTAALMADWTLSSLWPGTTFALDPVNGHGGGKCLRMDNIGGGSALGPTVARIVNGLVPTSGNITLQGWYRRAVPACYGRQNGPQGASVSNIALTSSRGVVLASDTWVAFDTALSCSFSGGSARVKAGWGIVSYGEACPGSIYFDDLKLSISSTVIVAAETHALEFGFPLIGARAWGAPSPGSQAIVYPSGFADAWIEEEDQFLEGRVLHIPAEDGASTYGPASGWNGPGGWQAFLDFARNGNTFEFWRDADDAGSAVTCYLVEPMREPEIDAGVYRGLTLRLRSADNSRFGGY